MPEHLPNYLGNFIQSCFKNFIVSIKPFNFPKYQVQQFSFIKPVEELRNVRCTILNITSDISVESFPNILDPVSLERYFEKRNFGNFGRRDSCLAPYLQKTSKEFINKQVKRKFHQKRRFLTESRKFEKRTERKDEKKETRKAQSKTEKSDLDLMKYVQKELELMDKYLSLHLQDSNFLREHVHVTLHISLKHVSLLTDFEVMKSRRQQIRVLCKQAILCLIEPSENAFVRYENDLSEVIQQYLKIGCNPHFDIITRKDLAFYWSALVISSWAKVLFRHPDTTLIHTISCSLGCEPEQILVLSYPEDKKDKKEEL